MSKGDNSDLKKFLKPYPEEVQEMALWLRDFVWDLCPNCNELIYDKDKNQLMKSATITKSISPVKKRPGQLKLSKPVSKKIKSLS
jgi:hypothetical protein